MKKAEMVRALSEALDRYEDKCNLRRRLIAQCDHRRPDFEARMRAADLAASLEKDEAFRLVGCVYAVLGRQP